MNQWKFKCEGESRCKDCVSNKTFATACDVSVDELTLIFNETAITSSDDESDDEPDWDLKFGGKQHAVYCKAGKGCSHECFLEDQYCGPLTKNRTPKKGSHKLNWSVFVCVYCEAEFKPGPQGHPLQLYRCPYCKCEAARGKCFHGGRINHFACDLH